MNELCGAFLDREGTDAWCAEREAAGDCPYLTTALPALDGFGANKSVFLWDAESLLHGKPLPSWVQHRGTCVGQAVGRAIQDAYWNAIAFGQLIGEALYLCWEHIYAGSRQDIRKHRWGGEDGAYPIDAMKLIREHGLIPRGMYGTIDLTNPREDLAVRWGEDGHGVPRQILDEAAKYPARAVYRCTSPEAVRDALAARYGVFRAAPRATGIHRDADGMARVVKSGGHAQCLRGVFVDWKGRTCFVEQQSWPQGARPEGGGPLRLNDGRRVDLPEGAAGIHWDEVANYCEIGEVWAIAPPKSPWRQNLSPSEVIV